MTKVYRYASLFELWYMLRSDEERHLSAIAKIILTESDLRLIKASVDDNGSLLKVAEIARKVNRSYYEVQRQLRIIERRLYSILLMVRERGYDQVVQSIKDKSPDCPFEAFEVECHTQKMFSYLEISTLGEIADLFSRGRLNGCRFIGAERLKAIHRLLAVTEWWSIDEDNLKIILSGDMYPQLPE